MPVWLGQKIQAVSRASVLTLSAMPVTDLPAVPGVRIGTAEACIRYRGRDDLVVFELAPGSVVAAVFTTNAFCAAPVTVARRHLAEHGTRYLLINAGNANAGTGRAGLDDALATCRLVAEATGCHASEVLPFSTGVIGERLPVTRFTDGISAALAALDPGGWLTAARAIMTTDTVPKGVGVTIADADVTYTLTGIAKGAGMIRPDMATMLAFLATDAPLTARQADALLGGAVSKTLNRVTIDGDTSTNDACVLVATGASGGGALSDAFVEGPFAAALTDVLDALARAIARDGEGANRLVTVRVTGGRDEAECAKVAFTVAESPLVKTALYAADPNWGRILAAVGRAGVPELDIERVDLALGPHRVLTRGQPDPSYAESEAAAYLAGDEVDVRIALGRGEAEDRVYTCDFSEDYVRINADYRS